MTYVAKGQPPLVIEIADNGDYRAELGFGRQLIVEGDEAFIVQERLTGPLVMRLEDLSVLAAERTARNLISSRQYFPPTPLLRRGNAEINGRSGRAYFRPRDGEPAEYRVVVISDDPALAFLGPVMRQVRAAEDALMALETDLAGGGGVDDRPLHQLLEEGTPLSLYGRDLRDVERKAIDPAGFVLPAEPVTLEVRRTQMVTEAEQAERGPSADTMISRAFFAAGRLWLLTDAGGLSSLAEGETRLRPEDPGGPVLDLCLVDNAPVVLSSRHGSGAWQVRRLEGGRWQPVGTVAPQDDRLVALSCGPDWQLVLTNRRLIDLAEAGREAVGLVGELSGARVRSVVHADSNAVYVGINAGEWGGGLRRIDRRTGRIETIERTTGGLCDGPLNTDCDPVNGIAAIPWQPRCVAAAIGLVHMLAHGRIVSVCPDGVEQMFVARGEIDPEDARATAEANTGGYGSIAFFDLAARGDGLIAAGHDGLYRIDATGAGARAAWPRFQAIDGLLVSFALPDVVLVMTEINRRASVSGVAPILVLR